MNNERTMKWHKYPEERPIFEDYYIVSEKAGDEYITVTSVAEYDKGLNKFIAIEAYDPEVLDTVIAWAELPEPYNNEGEK